MDMRFLEVTDAEAERATNVLAVRVGSISFVLQYRQPMGESSRGAVMSAWTHVPVVWIAPGDNDGKIR